MGESKLGAISQDKPAVSPKPHILIIGAGITGLVLAQALKKHGIAFAIFERDANVSARGRGWGLTIHWSLDTFISLLPQHIVDKLPQVYVDPEASKRGENGNFLFFDLRSGETRWKVPPNKRIRVSRERLRALLLEGLDVQVGYIVIAEADIFGEPQLIESVYSVLYSGPNPSTQSPIPISIRSPPTSETPRRLQVRCLSEPMAVDQRFDHCCWHTIPQLLSTTHSPCGFWAPASCTLRNLPSA